MKRSRQRLEQKVLAERSDQIRKDIEDKHWMFVKREGVVKPKVIYDKGDDGCLKMAIRDLDLDPEKNNNVALTRVKVFGGML